MVEIGDMYSISTSNRFDVFMNDEDDPGDDVFAGINRPPVETTQNIKQEKTTKIKPKERQQQPKAPPRQADDDTKHDERPKQVRHSKSSEKVEGQRRPQGGSASSYSGGTKPQQQRRFADRSRGEEGEDMEGKQRDRNGRPRRGGRGGAVRTSSTSGSGPRVGKREYDRRSGSDKTSIKAVEKREGGGAHNWGKPEDELQAGEQAEWTPEETVEPTVPPEETPKEDPQEGEEVTTPQVEEPKEMTLDEYKALKQKERAKVNYQERHIEGDEVQWKNTAVLKKEEDEFFSGTREVIEKIKTSGRKHETLETNFFFKDPSKEKRGGGRGGSRGRDGPGRGERTERGDRNRDRGERSERSDHGDHGRGSSRGTGRRGGRGGGQGRRDRAPDVGNEQDFPALGGM